MPRLFSLNPQFPQRVTISPLSRLRVSVSPVETSRPLNLPPESAPKTPKSRLSLIWVMTHVPAPYGEPESHFPARHRESDNLRKTAKGGRSRLVVAARDPGRRPETATPRPRRDSPPGSDNSPEFARERDTGEGRAARHLLDRGQAPTALVVDGDLFIFILGYYVGLLVHARP